MKTHEFTSDHAQVYYDTEIKLLRISYRGALSPAVTAQVYGWIDKLLDDLSAAAIHGTIFDFSEVTEFQLGNIQSARQSSKQLHSHHDISNIPTALLAANPYQEGMIRVNMKLNPDHDRIRLVASENEAVRFIDEWHRAKAKNDPVNSADHPDEAN